MGAPVGFPALAIKPPESPIQQLGGALALKNAVQQSQLGDVELQNARQVQQSNQTLMDMLARNNGDMNQTYADAAASGKVLPQHLEAFKQSALASQLQAANLAEKDLQNLGKTHDLAFNELEGFRNLPLSQRTPDAVKAIMGRMANSGVDVSKLMPVFQSVANDPSDANLKTIEIGLNVEKWLATNEAQQRLASMPTVAQAQARTTAELTTAQNAATRSVVELNALPQQLQDAHKKNVAEVAQASASTALQTEQLHQLRQSEEYIRNPDPTGFTTPLPVNEYNKRYDSFTQGDVYKQVKSVQGSYQQFGTILNDLDSNKPLTGAASVVALFDAVGISATPLAGKGFRINSNVIGEHVGARGLDQSVLQKVLSLKQGDIITPDQVRDYASIAANVYKQTYINAADEAHREGLPADFLPRGGGKMIDSTTAKIYANVVAHERPDLAKNPGELQQAAMAAARQNGWQVDDGVRQ